MHLVGAFKLQVASQTSSWLIAIFPCGKIEIKILIFLRDPSKRFLLHSLPGVSFPNCQNPNLQMVDSPICRLQPSAFLNVGPKC